MSGQTEKSQHSFSVLKRGEMKIDGVEDVDRFDEQTVVLQTTEGTMTVEGGALRVGALDVERGVVTLSGRIDAVYYSTERADEKRSWLGKLFR